jgi:hypothetical protein
MTAALVPLVVACTQRDRAPDGAASAPPPAVPPVTAPPSGAYHVVVKRILDTCTPKQIVEGAADVFVLAHVAPGAVPTASVPLVVLEPGRIAVPRLELRLGVGQSIHNAHALAHHARAIFDAKVDELREDGFSLRVVRTWDGIDAQDAGVGAAPSAPCRAEEDVAFTLVSSLCPARCKFDPRVLSDGGMAGDCACDAPP